MSEDTTVSFSLEVNVAKAYEDVRRLQTVLYRTMSLIRRVSGDENINITIMEIQRMIAWLNQLRLAIIAVQVASGPIGLALAGLSVASTVAYDVNWGGVGRSLARERGRG